MIPHRLVVKLANIVKVDKVASYIKRLAEYGSAGMKVFSPVIISASNRPDAGPSVSP
jgi:hypothetical protein